MTQLQSTGAQDDHLTNGADRSFFLGRHKRHTAFAMEPKDIQFNGTPDWGRKITAVIPRSADLLARMYLVIDLAGFVPQVPETPGSFFTDDVGRAMIESVTLESGSVCYDVLWPELLHTLDELTTPLDKQLGRLTGKNPDVTARRAYAQGTQRLYVPLPYWFQEDYTQTLPLIQMHLTDITVSVKLKSPPWPRS
jgi:hypothetical protein